MLFDRDNQDTLTLKKVNEGRRGGIPPWLWIVFILAVLVSAAVYGYRLWHQRAGAEAERSPTPSEPSPAVTQDADAQFLVESRALMSDGKPAEAREPCYKILETSQNPTFIGAAEILLGKINMDLLFTPQMMPEKEEYVVQTGDSLDRIAKKFHTTVELIQKSNPIQRQTIHPGDRLRVFKAVFSIEIFKTRNTLILKADNRFFKRYAVGTGKYGTTPVGAFIVADKIMEPPWWKPDGKVIPFGDKENVLGSRWMSLNAVEGTEPVRGYGIHGTWEPETIGKQSSAGCIRLLNADVEELFLAVPLETRVTILE